MLHGVVKAKWSDATQDAEDKVIDGLDKTDLDDRMADESKEPKDKEKRCEKNRNSDDDLYCFIFSIFSVDVVFFDYSEFLYTSSPIPDFIIT
ncbi:MAG: hypothetical protein IMZ53_16665 [Thermoplasmata archaeon]|nr:hypothetical protein [Thermoplasmata archaeon]